MNIIIPLNGIGKRFIDANYSLPKPLIKVMGKTMIERVIENLSFGEEDQLFLIYNKQLGGYNFSSFIKFKFPNLKINLISLDFKTRGAAETLLCGLNNMKNLSIPGCMVFDCDTIYKDNVIEKYRKTKDNRVFYFNDNTENEIFSYIKTNSEGEVVEVKEKKKISNKANTGLYCFENALLLKKYCQKLLDSNITTNNEFYTSGVLQHMIKDGIKINSTFTTDFFCVGTPLQLKSYCYFDGSIEVKRFCFDIDNTLLTYPEIPGDYNTCKPITQTVNFLKFLKSMGHYIILHTARRMKTHNSNLGKVVADIGDITLKSLKKHRIPYDEIHFGKPYADFYIDDLAIDAKSNLEKQTGFYKTHVEPRNFHNIIFKENTVIKEGELSGENFWYQNIPMEINQYIPTIYSCSDKKIQMEKISGTPFSFLYVNNSLTKSNLESLLLTIEKFHIPCECEKIYENYLTKTRDRFHEYDYSKFFNSVEVYKSIYRNLKIYEQEKLGEPSLVHGDPVFTNVFLDADGNIKLIDPKGKQGEKLSVYGDKFYDYAKIYQSLIGYDNILLNKEINHDYLEEMVFHFENYITKKWDKERMKKIKLLTESLLFSLLPLHDNENCQKFYDLIFQINRRKE